MYLNALYTLLYTLPGIPSIYYGSEWGIGGVKENNSDQPLRPYIDIHEPPAAADKNLAEYISRLASVRQGQKALKYGGYRQVFIAYQRPFVFERFDDTERIFVAVNSAAKDEVVDVSGWGAAGYTDLLSGDQVFADLMPMAPCSARILKAK
jgi:glycosidase